MADQLLERVEEQIQNAHGANIVNIPLSNSEKKHVAEVQQRLKEGYRYECQVKSFVDWKEGAYTVLAVSLDGATHLVLSDGGPTVKQGMIGECPSQVSEARDAIYNCNVPWYGGNRKV